MFTFKSSTIFATAFQIVCTIKRTIESSAEPPIKFTLKTLKIMKKLTLLLAFLLNFVYLCTSQDYIGKQKCDIQALLKEQSPAITIAKEPDSSLYLTCKNELLGIPFVYFFDSNYVCRKYVVLYNKQDGEDLSNYLNEMLTKIDYSSWLDETKDYLYTILQSNKFTVMSIEILKLPKNE